MDIFNLEAFADKLNRVKVKTASALRELLDGGSSAQSADLDTARGRLLAFFDEGTFSEIGAYVRRRMGDLDTADSAELESVICGWGAVNGRLVFAYCQDTSRASGAVSEAHARKICELYRLAMENGAPVFAFLDSAGALIPEGVRALAGYGKIMKAVSAASGVIPQIAVATGYVSGAGAVICGMYDLVIKTDDASISVNPPFLTDAKGRADSGIVASRVADKAEAISLARELTAYIPSNNFEGASEDISSDEVNKAVSIDSYYASIDVHDFVKSVFDDGKLIELYADYGQSIVGGLASIGGTAVGIIATNKSVNGGVLTAEGARKASRLVSFFDSFNIPIVTLVDSKGLDRDATSEASPFTAELGKLASAYAAAEAPKVTVILGEAYGSLYTVLGSKSIGADVVYALDSAKIAAMNAESAVAFLYNDEISASITREELEKRWDDAVATPVEAASSGEIDDIIDSAEARVRIAAALAMLSSKSQTPASRRHLIMPL